VAVIGVRVTESQLLHEVDNSLTRQVARLVGNPSIAQGQSPSHDDHGVPDGDRSGDVAGGAGQFQVINAQGAVVLSTALTQSLPVDATDISVANGTYASVKRDRDIGGVRYRMITARSSSGFALQVARPMDDVDHTLRSLWIGFGIVGAGGIIVAAGLGIVVTRRALRPVADLSAAAWKVAETQDPSLSVPETGGAELAQLGHSINQMLKALDQSHQEQRRLIDDAAHELRTPLTSLRTNIEVLAGGRISAGPDRDSLIADVKGQLEELSSLINDLDQLARNNRIEHDRSPVAIEDLVNGTVARAQLRSPNNPIVVSLTDPGITEGAGNLLERALLNVIDNAIKWSPSGSPVDVDVNGTAITVRDRGPGIAQADLPHVFDRFWRSDDARTMPGSGLGLSIVSNIIESHGGAVSIDNHPDGGARVRISLVAAHQDS
jgi:two-component system sensor histidine kinase MprB